MEEVEADLPMESLEAALRVQADRRDGGQRGTSEEALAEEEVDGEEEAESSATFAIALAFFSPSARTPGEARLAALFFLREARLAAAGSGGDTCCPGPDGPGTVTKMGVFVPV